MSTIQKNLHNLAQTEVTRKEFLHIACIAVLSIFGLGTILKLLTGRSLETHSLLTDNEPSAYGGANEGVRKA